MLKLQVYQPTFLYVQAVHTGILQKRMEKILDKNQSREQAGLKIFYSVIIHLQTINQLIEYNEFSVPLCIGYNDYLKATD